MGVGAWVEVVPETVGVGCGVLPVVPGESAGGESVVCGGSAVAVSEGDVVSGDAAVVVS